MIWLQTNSKLLFISIYRPHCWYSLNIDMAHNEQLANMDHYNRTHNNPIHTHYRTWRHPCRIMVHTRPCTSSRNSVRSPSSPNQLRQQQPNWTNSCRSLFLPKVLNEPNFIPVPNELMHDQNTSGNLYKEKENTKRHKNKGRLLRQMCK